VPTQFKGLKSTERCGLEKVAELGGLKRLREPGTIDEFYSKRMKICKLDDSNIDEHTRKVQVSNWDSIIKQQRQRVSALQTLPLLVLSSSTSRILNVSCYQFHLSCRQTLLISLPLCPISPAAHFIPISKNGGQFPFSII
jgi:hypothetical protein